jgi:hypothetical protein
MNYLIPTICTIAIIVSLFFHFKKFKNIYIIISSVVLYYWSIAGSWFFILDRENPALGKKLGIHFHYYLDVLYPVQIDFYYFKAIILYTLFILSFIWGSYFFLKVRKPAVQKLSSPIHLNPVFILLPALVGMAISCFSVHEEIMSSIRHFKSFYYTINADTTQRFHTLHLASNTLMAISSYAFLGLIMSPNGNFLVLDKSSKFIYRLGIFLLALVLGYLILLGGRNYFIFGALLIFVLAYENSGTKQWLKKVVIGGIVLIAPLFLTELTRGTPIISLAIYELNKPKNHSEQTQNGREDFFFDEEKQEKYQVSGVSTLQSLLYSNEMFVPAFSMYAVLKEDIPITNGKSLAWLVSSIIPSFVGIERPEDSYKYYIQHTRAAEVKNQGFTIHHATGWYLNFGILGTIIGGLILSMVLSIGYKKYKSAYRKWHKLCWFSAFAGTFIFIPRLIRSGPEGYKSIFLIAILFLMVVLLCGTLLTKKQTD